MHNLGRTDVERIVEEVLKNLSIVVKHGATNNICHIELKFKETVLSDTCVSVIDTGHK
jgi:hypothetical protein